MITTLPYEARKNVVMSYMFSISRLTGYWWEYKPDWYDYYWKDKRVSEEEFINLAWKQSATRIIKSLVRR